LPKGILTTAYAVEKFSESVIIKGLVRWFEEGSDGIEVIFKGAGKQGKALQ
jgi:hypothetical protein